MDAVQVVRDRLPVLLESGQELRMAVAQLAARFNIQEAGPALRDLLADQNRTGAERAGALLSLAATDPDDLRQVVDMALKDSEERVRAAGRVLLARLDPTAAVSTLDEVLREGSTLERQSALAALADAAVPEADALLSEQLRQLLDQSLPAEIQLDVLTAAQRRTPHSAELATLVTAHQKSLDAEDPLARTESPWSAAMPGVVNVSFTIAWTSLVLGVTESTDAEEMSGPTSPTSANAWTGNSCYNRSFNPMPRSPRGSKVSSSQPGEAGSSAGSSRRSPRRS